MRIIGYFLAFLCLFFSRTTLAEDAENEKKHLYQYITTNKEHIASLKNKQEKIFKRTFPTCEQDPTIKRLKPSILTETDFIINEDDSTTRHPKKGQWVEKAVLTACQKSVQINIVTVAYAPQKTPLLLPLISGQTKIDLLQQRKAFETVKKELSNKSECLNNDVVTNTSFLGYRTKNKKKAKDDHHLGWFERWSFSGCKNQDVLINIAVLPHPRTKYYFIARLQEQQ